MFKPERIMVRAVVPKSSDVLSITHRGVQTSSPGHVDIEAFSSTRSHLQHKHTQRDLLRQCILHGDAVNNIEVLEAQHV